MKEKPIRFQHDGITYRQTPHRMIQYVHFNSRVREELHLSVAEVVFIDYGLQFQESETMCHEIVDGEHCWWLNFKKVAQDIGEELGIPVPEVMDAKALKYVTRRMGDFVHNLAKKTYNNIPIIKLHEPRNAKGKRLSTKTGGKKIFISYNYPLINMLIGDPYNLRKRNEQKYIPSEKLAIRYGIDRDSIIAEVTDLVSSFDLHPFRVSYEVETEAVEMEAPELENLEYNTIARSYAEQVYGYTTLGTKGGTPTNMGVPTLSTPTNMGVPMGGTPTGVGLIELLYYSTVNNIELLPAVENPLAMESSPSEATPLQVNEGDNLVDSTATADDPVTAGLSNSLEEIPVIANSIVNSTFPPPPVAATPLPPTVTDYYTALFGDKAASIMAKYNKEELEYGMNQLDSAMSVKEVITPSGYMLGILGKLGDQFRNTPAKDNTPEVLEVKPVRGKLRENYNYTLEAGHLHENYTFTCPKCGSPTAFGVFGKCECGAKIKWDRSQSCADDPAVVTEITAAIAAMQAAETQARIRRERAATKAITSSVYVESQDHTYYSCKCDCGAGVTIEAERCPACGARYSIPPAQIITNYQTALALSGQI